MGWRDRNDNNAHDVKATNEIAFCGATFAYTKVLTPVLRISL
jgi:hypothetical protein